MSTEYYHLDLDALLEADLSSYEYFVGLPPSVKRKLESMEVHSLADLQSAAEKIQQEGGAHDA